MPTFEVKSPDGKPFVDRFTGTAHAEGEKLFFSADSGVLRFAHQRPNEAQHEPVSLRSEIDRQTAADWVAEQVKAGRLIEEKPVTAEKPVKPADKAPESSTTATTTKAPVQEAIVKQTVQTEQPEAPPPPTEVGATVKQFVEE